MGVGTTQGLIYGENIGDAVNMGFQTGSYGFVFGVLSGGYKGFMDARANGLNPWNGKSNVKNQNSSFRTEPKSLREQLTLKEAQSGQGHVIMEGKINDPNWQGWQKMEHTRISPTKFSITSNKAGTI